ncbi:type IV pilin protein [Saccharophagus degradans]|uniref:type IV pilin protein n=1 Tax=Saccharophagus degradans TaxID=86304 RepID=UPI001C09D00D|nr:type IV pilin protein [Saccharophagus degradans]MBU2987588.1 type IV pilin protein [Saccharophagus degradans]
MRNYRKVSAGFTLIEAIVVVAIVGIISAFAISTYSGSIEKTRRADGKAAVLRAAAAQEKWYAQNNQYSADMSVLGGTNSSEGYYTLAATNALNGVACASRTCFTITATATGAQASDTECGILTVDNIGRKRSYRLGTTTETQNCW